MATRGHFIDARILPLSRQQKNCKKNPLDARPCIKAVGADSIGRGIAVWKDV